MSHYYISDRELNHIKIQDAVFKNDVSGLENLLKKQIRIVNKWFLDAVEFGCDLKIIKLFLNHGYDLNITNKYGEPLVHLSCRNFDVEMTTFFLNLGARKTLLDRKGTDLMEALAISFVESCQILEFDRNNEIADDDAQEYAEVQESTVRLMELFFKHGIRLSAEDNDHRTIVGVMLPYATMDFIQMWNRLGFNIKYVDEALGNRTLLHNAAEHGNYEAAAELMCHIDINAQSSSGTPLHVAAFFGRDKCARILINSGCDVNATMRPGITPLYIAFISKYAGSEIVFEMLIKNRSNVDSVVMHNAEMIETIRRLDIATLNSEKLLLLVRHLIKLKKADFFVGKCTIPLILKNKEVLQKLNVPDFAAECASEVRKLKEKKISGVSLFHLMTDYDTLSALYEDKDVVDYFTSKVYMLEFPLYKDTLQIAFKKVAIDKRKLKEKTSILSQGIFSYTVRSAEAKRLKYCGQ